MKIDFLRISAGFSYALPHAFTEHGVLMLANVLNSERAVRVSVQVVRAFIRLRETVAAHADLARKLAEMEKKYDTNSKWSSRRSAS